MNEEDTVKYLNYVLSKGTLDKADQSLVMSGISILMQKNRELKEMYEQLRERMIQKAE